MSGPEQDLPDGAAPSAAVTRPARLKTRREFLRVAGKGRRAARPGVVVQALAQERPGLRVGFTVTKKVGNAVVRNRARRRLREAARIALREGVREVPGGGWDLVLIGRDATPTREFTKLLGDLRGALDQAGVRGAPTAGRGR